MYKVSISLHYNL